MSKPNGKDPQPPKPGEAARLSLTADLLEAVAAMNAEVLLEAAATLREQAAKARKSDHVQA